MKKKERYALISLILFSILSGALFSNNMVVLNLLDAKAKEALPTSNAVKTLEYSVNLNTSKKEVIKTVSIQDKNHNEKVINNNVKWESIKIWLWKIPMPVFVLTVISVVSIGSGLVTYAALRYFSVPRVVRLINKIEKFVMNGENVPLKIIVDVKTREELIKEKVKRRFETMGFGDVLERSLFSKREKEIRA